MGWEGETDMSGCGCGLCGQINGLFDNQETIPNTVYLAILDPEKGCSRTTLKNLLASNSDKLAQVVTDGHVIAQHTDAAGNTVDVLETITIVDGENFNATTNVLSFDYTDETGTKKTLEWDLSGLAIDINVGSMAYNPTTGELTLTETDGTPHVVTIASSAVPDYTTCADAILKTTDKILLAPTAFKSGYGVNQETAGACVSRDDHYFDLARRSHTFNKNYLANDAQGYGSSVTGGTRNTTATAASYSHIGGGYDHSITAGTANTIGGGRNNDIVAGSYNAIVGGYNNDIIAGSYNTVGGVSHDVDGGYNSVFGATNKAEASYGFQGGRIHTITAGNNVTQLGYGHLNTSGGSTFQAGYDHTNTSGSYNTQLGFRNVVEVGQSTVLAGQANVNTAGNYTVMLGTGHVNTTGSGNAMLGVNHENTSGAYNFLANRNGLVRSGNYNALIGYSHDNTGTGNMLLGYNNTANTNYSVTIGRNLTNVTQDSVMIANTFQKVGFYGVVPVAKQTLPAVASAAQLTLALRNLGLVN